MVELNLLIIWEKARYKEKDIITDLRGSFELCEIYDLAWGESIFHTNLTRFYGEKLPAGSGKEKHCGCGRFVLVTFVDKTPKYEHRETSRGAELVNINVFDKKKLYRKWTGGGHRIHTTNGEHEIVHDLMLLLGKDVKEYIQDCYYAKLPFTKCIKDKINLNRNIEGAEAWSSLSYLFYYLNKVSKYVVMRNFQCLPDKFDLGVDGDIDFLVSNTQEFAYLINAEKSPEHFRPYAYTIKVGDQNIPVDIREVGDGYYDVDWESNILISAIIKNGISIPSETNYLAMLAYHSLIHKQEIKTEYKSIFESNNIALNDLPIYLSEFLSEHKYSLEIPKDISVYYHFNNALKLAIRRKKVNPFTLFLRKLRQYYVHFRIKIHHPLKKIKAKVKSLSSKSPLRGFLEYMIIFKCLTAKGYKKIKFYKRNSWHEKVYYFTAVDRLNNKVFIKTSGEYSAAIREYKALNLLKDSKTKCFPKLIEYFDVYLFSFVLIEFIEGDLLTNSQIAEQNFVHFCNVISNELNEKGIIHRDIRPDNIMLDTDDNLILFDFGWCIIDDNQFNDSKNVEKLYFLGESYKPDTFLWNDGFSLNKIYYEHFSKNLNLSATKSYIFRK